MIDLDLLFPPFLNLVLLPATLLENMRRRPEDGGCYGIYNGHNGPMRFGVYHRAVGSLPGYITSTNQHF